MQYERKPANTVDRFADTYWRSANHLTRHETPDDASGAEGSRQRKTRPKISVLTLLRRQRCIDRLQGT
jgi:hypothetical protein